MPLLEPDAALDLARRVVGASDADETEVTVESEVDRFVRYAEVGPTQNADRERVEVAVRVRFRDGPGDGRGGDGGWREARATAGSADEADARAALSRALELARISPANADAVELGGPARVAATALDSATLEHGFVEKARWIGAAVDACAERGLRPSGLARTTGIARAVASSTGREVHGFFNRASLSLTATGETGSGFGEGIAGRVEDLDPEAVVRRAVEKASRAQDPRALPPGEYTVLLEPSAVSSVLLFASYQGFGAREVEEQASFLCGRTGEAVFPDSISLADDAANDVYPGIPFDGEGTPRARTPLIDRGVPVGPVTDRAYARKLGTACTGHARPQPSREGPMATNLVLQAGSRSNAELIASIDRGLLVTQFHYTNMIEPRDLTLTGMTRNGTFLIEGGEVVGAVRNLRFTETLVNTLRRVREVGSEAEVAGALFDGEIVCPALLVDGFRFTSTADF